MKKIYLINRLKDNDDEEEVYIKLDDTLYELRFENIPEYFDGFETVYPECLALVPIIE